MNDREPTTTADASRTSGSTSMSLLALVRENESTAWDRLVTLYSPLIYHWCRRLDVPEHEISDIFQEVFQSIVKNLDKFHKEKAGDTFRGWMRTITRNKVFDYYRKLGRQPAGVGGTEANIRLSGVPGAETDDDDGGEEVRFRSLLLQRALEAIRPDFAEHTWRAFWRVAIDGSAPKDVADELEMSSGAVRVAKCRVLNRLRRELGELPE